MDNTAYDNYAGKDEAKESAPQFKASVEIMVPDAESTGRPEKPYSGMGKEDLLYFSNAPFWRNLRLIFVLVFWVGWAALLAAVVVLTVQAPRCDPAPTKEWWQTSNLYQIYVDSFYDSNGDGRGDINGITAKLNYFTDNNLNALMISSVYESDASSEYSYAITDHSAVDAKYGNIGDLQQLIDNAHTQDMFVILDFVPNHVSVEHPWFLSKDFDFRDFFVLVAKPTGGCADINNWRAVFGGSAWHDDPDDPGMCYLGQISRDHPDLNLRNERVRQSLDAILGTWLNVGVDGFRIIATELLYEDYELRDDDVTSCEGDVGYGCITHNSTSHQPENINIIARWRDVLDKFVTEPSNQKVLLADVHGNANDTVMYFGTSTIKAAHLALYYGLNNVLEPACAGTCIRKAVDELVQANTLSGVTFSWQTSGQDVERAIFRKGVRYANVINVLRNTLIGVGPTYFAEELGMRSGDYDYITCTDPWFLNATYVGVFCRDNSRTLMAWTPEGGFVNETVSPPPEPWIDYSPRINETNVQTQAASSRSTLTLMKSLADMRMEYEALQYGDHIFIDTGEDDIVSYVREYEGIDRLLVALNFGNDTLRINTRGDAAMDVPEEAEVVLDTEGQYGEGDSVNMGSVQLTGGQGVIFKWPYTR